MTVSLPPVKRWAVAGLLSLCALSIVETALLADSLVRGVLVERQFGRFRRMVLHTSLGRPGSARWRPL